MYSMVQKISHRPRRISGIGNSHQGISREPCLARAPGPECSLPWQLAICKVWVYFSLMQHFPSDKTAIFGGRMVFAGKKKMDLESELRA